MIIYFVIMYYECRMTYKRKNNYNRNRYLKVIRNVVIFLIVLNNSDVYGNRTKRITCHKTIISLNGHYTKYIMYFIRNFNVIHFTPVSR